MEFVAYTIFILALAAPFLAVAATLGLITVGVWRVFTEFASQKRLDFLGVAMTAIGLVAGSTFYHWWCGPEAELAKLEPLTNDRQLAKNLPRTWVFDYSASGAVFDVVSRGYADRVLNSYISSTSLRASIPDGRQESFMEEIELLDSVSCKSFAASGTKDTDQEFKCITRSAVSKADIMADGPYLTLSNGTIGDARTVTYSLVRNGHSMPIARCIGRAPRETNAILALVRRDRSLEVASSIYDCKMRAASGGLSRVIATGKVG